MILWMSKILKFQPHLRITPFIEKTFKCLQNWFRSLFISNLKLSKETLIKLKCNMGLEICYIQYSKMMLIIQILRKVD